MKLGSDRQRSRRVCSYDCTSEQEMKIGKAQKHNYLIFMIAVLIAVSVFITKRSA